MPMLIRTILQETEDRGIGLFTDEKIYKGQIIYRDDERFDRVFTFQEVREMPFCLRNHVETYASYSKLTDTFYLCCDNAKYWNHSDIPNTSYSYKSRSVVALTDVPEGTELTADYREFCDYCKEGDWGFIKL